ncbi:GDSL-type esterase/lipase family protein [Flavonifractor sp. AGMB03687]|uniref:GDSL-type esterase/lipase family protein n=1 Tax=Flavonifractor sp. AGMB03687 TaxID=2785133 RepID=UPI001ADFFB95|nr:GDSL-type esterase/lipase family protein [Flavonifractor sp. AGMB03687]
MSRSLYHKISEEPPPQPRRRRLPVILAAVVVAAVLVTVPVLNRSLAEGADPVPTATVSPSPTPEPTPTPTPAFDFSQPVPHGVSVDMDYFSDALFIGDSRTQGLRLYSGIKGATFYDYTGLSIFGVNNPGLVTVDGQSYSIVEALQKGPQFGKVYIAFGMNELGYYNTENYLATFGKFLDQVKEAQPNAVVYLQNLAPVDEAKCAKYGQASCITNARVAVFNELFAQLAREHRVCLVDVYSALSDENDGLPSEATSDGIHFQRPWYETWLACLMSHTVDPEAYRAGQTAMEGDRES